MDYEKQRKRWVKDFNVMGIIFGFAILLIILGFVIAVIMST